MRAFASYDSDKLGPEPIAEHADSLMGLDFVETPTAESPQVSKSQAFAGVKGYSIKTELDRKLLLGIWEQQDAQKLAAAELKDSPTPDVSSSKLYPK